MKNKGFTLIELMIVVAIIAIIAAIAIPNLLRSRLQSNEAAAQSNLKTIQNAEVQYNTAKGKYGVFSDLVTPGDGVASGFLDNSWKDGVVKSGYTYTLVSADANSFAATAAPQTANSTGINTYTTDQSGQLQKNGTAM